MANDVPKYFADFVKQNADEHGALAAKIEATRGKLEGVDKRLDDMNRLLLLVIAISGGSLATAVVGIILN